MAPDLARRRLLERTLAASAVGSVGSLSGCLDVSLFGDGPRPLASEMRRWGPSPASLPETEPRDAANYVLSGTDFRVARSAPERIRTTQLDPVVRRVAPLGLSAGDLRGSVGIGFVATVLRAEYDGDAVSDRLAEGGFDREGERGEFRLFRGELPVGGLDGERQTQPVVVGLDGKYVVTVPSNAATAPDEDDVVDTVASAGAGNTPRYAEVNNALDTLLSALERGLSVWASPVDPVTEADASPETGRFAGLVGRSRGVDLDGDVVRLRQLFLFDDPDSVDRTAVDAYVRSRWGEGESRVFHHRVTTVDGRIVRLGHEAAIDDVPTPRSR